MKDEDKTKKQLINELVEMRQRIAESAKSETERKRMEETLQYYHHFLKILNRHTEMIPMLKEVVAGVRKLTCCSAVGIRILDEEGNIPYEAYEGFPRRFYESESPLSINSDQCMCINVIKGAVDLKLPYYTEGGSFYTNGTTRFLATVSEEERSRTRNVCNEFGYESVALIPIRLGDHILGLIHLADPKENMVFLEMVQMLEKEAFQLGMGLKRFRAEEELRRKNEELESVIYSVSHDLKNPLITLEGFVSALEKDYGDRLDKKAKRHLGFIRDASGKMGVLVKDLLELSRIGKVVHPKEEVDFSEVVEESLKVLGTRIEERGIELVVADEFPVVRCDRQRMVQVMDNFLLNAIKFMGENPSPRIEIGYREEDEFHRFWVKDNGIGIERRYHGKIFELFQSSGEVEDAEGTGVGLTIVKKIIEHHGGRIWVESVKDQGSTFSFTLPKQ